MPDPFSAGERDVLSAALHDLIGTESEEQVILRPADGSPGTMDIVHLDDEFAVYLEGARGPVQLALPDGATLHDDSGDSQTIGFGPLEADAVVEVLASWAPAVLGDVPLEWSVEM